MEQDNSNLYYEYMTKVGDCLIPYLWYGPSPFRFLDTGKCVSTKQLREIVEKAGGIEEIYKICLLKKITWLQYLGIRKRTEEEKQEDIELCKDWTF